MSNTLTSWFEEPKWYLMFYHRIEECDGLSTVPVTLQYHTHVEPPSFLLPVLMLEIGLQTLADPR